MLVGGHQCAVCMCKRVNTSALVRAHVLEGCGGGVKTFGGLKLLRVGFVAPLGGGKVSQQRAREVTAPIGSWRPAAQRKRIHIR